MLVRLNTPHLVVFTLTFTSYALYHATRKTLSGVKSSISADWINNGTATGRAPHKPLFPDEPTAQTFLGSLDALFMICYAAALIFWGWLGDRLNPLNVVVFGMVGSAISLTAFGSVPYWLNFYSIPWYIFTWAIFGIVQACGWPNEVAIMAPFVINSILILAGAVVLWIFVTPKPGDNYHLLGSPRTVLVNRRHSSSSESNHDDDEQHPFININTRVNLTSRPIGICEAIFLPNVLSYCLCNACLKFVNYAFFFWLPFYLTYKYRWDESEANQLAVWYDIGGIIGSILGGFISDRLKHRSPVLFTSLLCSLPLLLLYANLKPDKLLHIFGMTLLGVTISGPYNLIVGTISVDLGSQPALAGNDKAMCTVTGLIDGTGSAGSALGQFFVPIIQNKLGWDWVFYLFIAMNILSAICLLRRFCCDIHLIWMAKKGTNIPNGTNNDRSEHQPLLNAN